MPITFAHWPAITIALCLSLLSGQIQATPYLPRDGAQVIETLPRRGDPQQRELRRLRTELSARPHDLALATSLAQRYIASARQATDPRYLGYAQAALAPWWSQPAPPPEVRLLRATILQSTHRFDAALADLDGVLAAKPGNAQAWLTRATVLTVRGDYTKATASCARLSSVADQLVTITCLANVAGMTGRSLKSEQLLDLTLQRSSNAAPELQAWSLTLLAELATRRGETASADQRYRRALAISPHDSYLLAAYADFLLDQQRPAEVLQLLKNQDRIDALLLRRALALQSAGDERELAKASAELRDRFAAAMQRGDTVHQREQARFALFLQHDAATALQLARNNWEVQKEAADMRILLEAAIRAHDARAAEPVLTWIAASGMEDVALTRLRQQLQPAKAGT